MIGSLFSSWSKYLSTNKILINYSVFMTMFQLSLSWEEAIGLAIGLLAGLLIQFGMFSGTKEEKADKVLEQAELERMETLKKTINTNSRKRAAERASREKFVHIASKNERTPLGSDEQSTSNRNEAESELQEPTTAPSPSTTPQSEKTEKSSIPSEKLEKAVRSRSKEALSNLFSGTCNGASSFDDSGKSALFYATVVFEPPTLYSKLKYSNPIHHSITQPSHENVNLTGLFRKQNL
jgi:hypothetical protein